MDSFNVHFEKELNNYGYSIITLDDLKTSEYEVDDLYTDTLDISHLSIDELLLLSDSQIKELLNEYNINTEEEVEEYDDEVEELDFTKYSFRYYMEDYKLYLDYDDWEDDNY